MNLQEKIQSMTAKEIILAMTDSLIKPLIININMNTFGTTKIKFFGLIEKEICFGCAATNTICKIANKTFTKNNIRISFDRAEFLNIDIYFLVQFERAIDHLRQGNINNSNSNSVIHYHDYNYFAKTIKIATITNNDNIELPYLGDNYTQEQLNQYILLANSQ